MIAQRLIFIFVLVSATLGCSSMGKGIKSFLAGDEPKTKTEESTQATEVSVNPFDKESAGHVPTRQYGRMTRTQMENEAQLNPRTGSLWRAEGQGGYLFSENNFRLLGDLLNVKLDGAPKEQLTSKAKIIRELWKKFEKGRAPASAKNKTDAATAETPAPTAADSKPAEGQNTAAVNTDEIDPSNEEKPLPVEIVPTRVLERMADGNYRVEGAQSFMIGKREYKVLVAGVVRAQDFNDQSIAATKLMDPRFDIVGAKKGSGILK